MEYWLIASANLQLAKWTITIFTRKVIELNGSWFPWLCLNYHCGYSITGFLHMFIALLRCLGQYTLTTGI